MGGVYCPTCEAGVEVTAKFCLSCGHDLTVQGPITATGHDLNQLKDVIRVRDDLSMAEKFDMIAKIEDGADPIALGIAAAGDDEDTAAPQDVPTAAVVAPALRATSWESDAADAAIELATAGTKLADLKASGSFSKEDERFVEAMDIGRTATLHLLEVSQGAVIPASEALQSVPIMQPPNKSFCPKCGSDIHSNTMLQWKKWNDMTDDALTVQLEAAMRASLMHLSAYRDQIQDLKDQLTDAKKQLEEADLHLHPPRINKCHQKGEKEGSFERKEGCSKIYAEKEEFPKETCRRWTLWRKETQENLRRRARWKSRMVLGRSSGHRLRPPRHWKNGEGCDDFGSLIGWQCTGT